jgi:ribosome-binding protein aMBF1 (putative translation factor)
MTKFFAPGVLMVFLASFLRFPNSSVEADNKSRQDKSEMTTSVSIGDQIHFSRLKLNLSQKELADEVGLGLTKLNIEKFEKGLLLPTKDVLAKMQTILETQIVSAD